MGAPFSALSFLKKIPSDLLCAYFKRFNKVNLCIFDEKNQKNSDFDGFLEGASRRG